MLKLCKIDIKEFKKTIYAEYKKLFPVSERKPYRIIKRSYDLGITEILKIVDENNLVGFMIINTIKNINIVGLDYLAIFPQYQDNGYGTKALELLKENYNNYNWIFVEIEKVEENEKDTTKTRRAKFYERAGFKRLPYDLTLFTVVYAPYVFKIKSNDDTNEKIMEDMFKIYIAFSSEKVIKNNCKYINTNEGG